MGIVILSDTIILVKLTK